MISVAEIRADDMIDEGFIGRSRAMRDVFEKIRMVAPTDSTVQVCGETGTGKELVARSVHRLSVRRAHAFVKCNCAALPTALKKTRWVLSRPRGAAARLGINRSTLQFRMRKLGIERPSISNEVTVR